MWYWLLVDPPWTQNCFSGQFCGSHFARLNNARIVLNHQPDCFSSFGFSWTKTLLIISSRSSSSYPMPSVRLDFVCWVLTHFWEKHKPVYHLLALLAHSSSAALAKKLDHLTPGRSRLRVQNPINLSDDLSAPSVIVPWANDRLHCRTVGTIQTPVSWWQSCIPVSNHDTIIGQYKCNMFVWSLYHCIYIYYAYYHLSIYLSIHPSIYLI